MQSWNKRSDVVSRRIAGETVLVPIRGSLETLQKLFMLDAVGEFVWDRMDQIGETEGLIDAVVEEYAVDRPTATNDVTEFIDALRSAGLIDGSGS